MSVEIEAKLKIDSPADVERKLSELGAEFVAEQSQTDIFLDDKDDSLISTDRCLRVRRQVVEDDERCFLCYKGGRETSEFKKRLELETEVKDSESLMRLFSVLGYEERLVVEKRRRLWKLGWCEVALDTLPLLGDFVEIEGPDAKRIADVQAKLGLSGLPEVADSYAHMIIMKHGGRTT
jgi:adenylate cyclase class 2